MAKKENKNEPLAVITSKEGEHWETILEATEARILAAKIQSELEEHMIPFLQAKCKEHSIVIEED